MLHELGITSSQIPRALEVASPDFPFDRYCERGRERLDYQNGNQDPVGCLLLFREVVRVMHTQRPWNRPQRAYNSDRLKPLDRPSLVLVQKAVRTFREVDSVRYRKRPVRFK